MAKTNRHTGGGWKVCDKVIMKSSLRLCQRAGGGGHQMASRRTPEGHCVVRIGRRYYKKKNRADYN